jgi:V8-like Glu-specific endopeptidase
MKAILLFLVSINLFAAPKVIYGEDNRLDWYQSENATYRELARSTAGMIKNDALKTYTDIIEIKGTTLRGRGACESERFSEQITAASCSGFLVGDDLLVTAGHCIKNMDDCNENSWVFDFNLKFEGDKANTVNKSDVYRCTKIIERAQKWFSKDDYALIKLDRKVNDRAPLKFRKSGQVKENTPLLVIGHPTGLPSKIADGANVRTLRGKYFKANLDTYGGNSGSAVFNTDTLEVEGILVRGMTDYVKKDGCLVSNRVSQDGGDGEGVTYITNIEALRD